MAMTKREKAQKLLEKLNSLEQKKSLTMQDEITNLTNKLKDNFAVKTLKSVEKIGEQVDQFKTDFNLKPVMDAIKQLEREIQQNEQNLRDELNTKLLAIPQTPDLTEEVRVLKSQFDAKLQGLGMEEVKKDIENFKTQLQAYVDSDIEEDKLGKAEVDKKFSELKLEVNRRFANLGGGSMNRQELFNGTDYLTRYTDINWKAGSNVTLTIANNDTTKKVDVTIAATGGGTGSGIVRSVNTVAISTAAGSATTTDYVYLASGTITITLPTTVGNSNLYTIKNIGAGTITIATTGGETIDGAVNLQMPVQFTSVDLISNNSGNWDIT